MNSGAPTATTAAVTPDGIIPNTYYDNSVTSCCSTPYVSAPSSPGRGVGYFYSAPSSPMHHFLISPTANYTSSGLVDGAAVSDRSSFEFDFGSGSVNNDKVDDIDDDDRSSTMSSADELFLNGQIRPMKLSSHLQQPQNLAPLIDVEDEEEEGEDEVAAIEAVRGRDWGKLRDRSLRRNARSLSPLRTDEFDQDQMKKKKADDDESSKIENPSASSPRSSSRGTSSKRWVFLKDFIRSKSYDTNSGRRKAASEKLQKTILAKEEFSQTVGVVVSRKCGHYSAKRAQGEEMRRKTFLSYRQGLLGCLGFIQFEKLSRHGWPHSNSQFRSL